MIPQTAVFKFLFLQIQCRKKGTNKLSVIEQIDNLDPDDVNYNRKTEDLNARLNKFYFDLDEIDNQIAELEKRLSNLQQNKINGETIYSYLACFNKYYDKFTDAEKKEFMHSFIERIEPKRTGQVMKKGE